MLKLLYRQNDYPIFQNRVFENKEDAINCQKGDIEIVEDLDSGLVYNASFNQELMSYDGNYQNEQGLSPLFCEHLNLVMSIIEKNIGRNDLIEVGCGKGFFLEMLADNGFDIKGFDPTYEGDSPRIKKTYFTSEVIDKADGLILRHVLEHIQNPVSFLEKLKEANGNTGLIYIEVPCFDWICKRRAWFDIFYEHVNYFRLSDFKRIFNSVIDSGSLFGGQYIYVIADLASLKKPKIDLNDRVDFPDDFMPKKILAESKHNAVWGGSSKGVIFSLIKERVGNPISTIIDINPAKQNKYIPATGLKIISPEQGLKELQVDDVIYIMNSNYTKEIKEMSNNQYHYIEVDNERF